MKQHISTLILEDNDDDFILINEIIAGSELIDAAVFRAERLEQALSMAESAVFDVAIIDLSLPDSNGLDTFAAFHDKHPYVPGIILTGHRDHEVAFEAVKRGAQDYLFKGELSQSAIVRSIRYAIERQRLVSELRLALNHVQQLQGLLPICAHCKNIRDDEGYWNRIESYFASRLETEFSHSICPECAKKYYPDIFDA